MLYSELLSTVLYCIVLYGRNLFDKYYLSNHYELVWWVWYEAKVWAYNDKGRGTTGVQTFSVYLGFGQIRYLINYPWFMEIMEP